MLMMMVQCSVLQGGTEMEKYGGRVTWMFGTEQTLSGLCIRQLMTELLLLDDL